MNARTEHRIVIPHGHTAQRVYDLQLISLNVEREARRILLIVSARVLAVIGDGQKATAQAIGLGDRRSIGVLGGFLQPRLAHLARGRR